MLLFITWILSFFASPIIHECPAHETETIEVNLKYSDRCKGKILISCFQKESNFRDPEKAVFSKVLECVESLQIDNIDPTLPRSIMAYMDKNGNGEIDLNLFGIPTEPYAVSNGYRAKWKEPDFIDAAEPATSKVITLEFKYWKER